MWAADTLLHLVTCRFSLFRKKEPYSVLMRWRWLQKKVSEQQSTAENRAIFRAEGLVLPAEKGFGAADGGLNHIVLFSDVSDLTLQNPVLMSWRWLQKKVSEQRMEA